MNDSHVTNSDSPLFLPLSERAQHWNDQDQGTLHGLSQAHRSPNTHCLEKGSAGTVKEPSMSGLPPEIHVIWDLGCWQVLLSCNHPPTRCGPLINQFSRMVSFPAEQMWSDGSEGSTELSQVSQHNGVDSKGNRGKVSVPIPPLPCVSVRQGAGTESLWTSVSSSVKWTK